MELAKRIKAARSKFGLSQSQAARAWETSIKNIQNWEQGHREPRGLARKHLESILKEAAAKDKPRKK